MLVCVGKTCPHWALQRRAIAVQDAAPPEADLCPVTLKEGQTDVSARPHGGPPLAASNTASAGPMAATKKATWQPGANSWHTWLK